MMSKPKKFSEFLDDVSDLEALVDSVSSEVSRMPWQDAVNIIDRLVSNAKLDALDMNDDIYAERLERAWQRILQG